MDIALKIRGLLEQKKLTQEVFAKKINKTKQTLSNYLSGRTKIDVDTLLKMSEVLEVNIGYFFGEETKSKNEKDYIEWFFRRFEYETEQLVLIDREVRKIMDKIEKGYIKKETNFEYKNDQAFSILFENEKILKIFREKFILLDYFYAKSAVMDLMKWFRSNYERLKKYD